MYCSKCGALNPDNANFCGKCGGPLDVPAPRRPRTVKPAPPPAVPPGHTRIKPPPPATPPYYAGFWKRFVARIIDDVILTFITGTIVVAIALVVGVPMEMSGFDDNVIAPVVAIYFIMTTTILKWLYYTIMESSGRQATLGKMALGIVVTDMDGARISFARANGRFWSKILSGLFFAIGYIIAGFTERKQALHDLLAATLVINR